MRQDNFVQGDSVRAGQHLAVLNVNTPKEELTERAQTFKDSLQLEARSSHERRDPTFRISDYRRELQEQLPQYYEEVLGWKGASGVARPTELKFRSSIQPPLPAPSSSHGRCDGDVRPQQEPPPSRAAEGAAWEGSGGDSPPRGGLTACEEGQRRQETINLLALDELVALFARAHHSG